LTLATSLGVPLLIPPEAIPLRTDGGHTILVVDDEPGILRGCERVLRAANHEVLLADRAEKGLEILRERPETELALVDLRMPGMDGLELLARARDVAPETVFVVITAYATIEAAVEATKRGAYDFLAKPFSPDELSRIVNRSLERVHLIRERNRLEAERRSRMLELATEKSRLRTIIDCMAEGVLVSNAEQELVLSNPAALKALKHDVDPGAPVTVGDAIASPELVALIEEASASRKRVSSELKLAEGREEKWALVDVAPVTDESSGQFLGAVTVVRDISELKRVEQVKAQFVNMVAHELRAPLAAVDGYLAVMLEGMVKEPEKQRSMIVRSRDRLGALLDLVGDLLDVARMEAGTVRREIDVRDLSEVIAEVVDLMQPMARENKITLRSAVASGLAGIEADREELVRLFSNLVSNAIKYNRPDGTVTVTAVQDGPYVKASVADTGVGISKEGVPKLFGEFFREKASATKHVTGTGLGLSIVKRIVDFYHGRVDVQSKLGEGSTFTVWLPCKRATAVAQ
jgi:two-component system phosphate regulon sensor histidine kinase PhoR